MEIVREKPKRRAMSHKEKVMQLLPYDKETLLDIIESVENAKREYNESMDMTLLQFKEQLKMLESMEGENV